jgi:C-terminal processing protease CtpA/Prc
LVTLERGTYTRYLPPAGRRWADGIGYIALPNFSVIERQVDYVAAARRIIATADEAPTCGWVIDLRLNTGGGYAPMVTGIGPILGVGPFLGWRLPDDQQLWVTYQGGGIYDDGRLVADDLARMPAYELQRPDPPVAVLTGPLTSSSGEVTTLAFVERPATRLFGERTGGFTTGNASYLLFDGALVALAEVAMTDRTGATHMDGVTPDELIRTDWTSYGTDADPVLAQATDWLSRQPACAAP